MSTDAPASKNLLAAVGVPVADLDASVAFYTEVLGLKKLQTIPLPDMVEAILGYPGQKGGAAIVLMQYKEGPKPDGAAFTGKLVFYVDEPKDVAEAVRARGLEVIREPEEIPGFGVVGFVTDPDGFRLEILPATR